jgi:hypothetical protein
VRYEVSYYARQNETLRPEALCNCFRIEMKGVTTSAHLREHGGVPTGSFNVPKVTCHATALLTLYLCRYKTFVTLSLLFGVQPASIRPCSLAQLVKRFRACYRTGGFIKVFTRSCHEPFESNSMSSHTNRLDSILPTGLREAKGLIQGPSARRTKDLLKFRFKIKINQV